ncbi:MAG: sugar-binding protein [bacterium]
MKKYLLLLAILSLVLGRTASAQNSTVLTNFDHAVRDGLFAIDAGTVIGGSQIWDFWTYGNAVTTMWDTSGGVQFEGEGAFKVQWFNFDTPGWGWYGNLWFHWDAYGVPDGPFIDLSNRDTIQLRYRVIAAEPDTSVRKFRFILFLYDGADHVLGEDARGEPWVSRTALELQTVTSDWQTLTVPLVDLGEESEEASVGRGFVYGGGDASWNRQLDFDKIAGYRFDISTTELTNIGDAGGTILLDIWEGTGNITRALDKTPPGPTQGVTVTATPGTPYSNTISWTPASEPYGRYNVYYHSKPITDLNDPLLDVVRIGVPENTSFIERQILAPNTDQNVTFYYTVVTYDRSRNASALGQSVSFTNLAKGVPTIANAAPPSYFADGDLSEWSAIRPTVISKETGSTVAAGQVTDANDLSANAYLAVDQNNLYVAFDVTDDLVYSDLNRVGEQNDTPELFIGLYDWHGLPHTGFSNRSEPDYILRFNEDKAIISHWWQGNYDLLAAGEDYLWTPKAPPARGYIVEAKIPFATLAAAIPESNDALFIPQEGQRIPIAFAINDRDADNPDSEREGALSYFADWGNPSQWTYTWVGNKMYVTSVETREDVPLTYQLLQNHPNPFNPSTKITYSLAKPGHVTLKIIDVLGHEVATLVDGNRIAGAHEVNFEAARLANGVYFYRLSADNGKFVSVRKMLVLK